MDYEISTTNGQWLRATMRFANSETLDTMLEIIAEYLGETADVEKFEDGRVVRGVIVATPRK